MNLMEEQRLKAAIDYVRTELVSVEFRTDFTCVRTPLLFPSGSSVVVQVSHSGPDFLVTDYGAGLDEADSMGASSVYVRLCRAIADSAGVSFDGHALYVGAVNEDQLPGAIVAVANGSLHAATITAYKLSERKVSAASDVLYDRLVSVFTRKYVAKDAEIVGQSTTKWHVGALVKFEHHPTVFDVVSSHHNSVFAAATKFHDISKLEQAPRRVAVVQKKAELKNYLALLSDSADVIEKDAPDEVLLQLANAA